MNKNVYSINEIQIIELLNSLYDYVVVFNLEDKKYDIIIDKKNYLNDIDKIGSLTQIFDQQNIKFKGNLFTNIELNYSIFEKEELREKKKIEYECFDQESNQIFKITLSSVGNSSYLYMVEKKKESNFFLENQEEFMKIMFSLSKDLPFKVDLNNNTISLFHSSKDSNNYKKTMDIDEFRKEKVIQEDLSIFDDMIYSMRQGIKKDFEFRIFYGSEYSWSRVRYELVLSSNKKVKTVLGQIYNIDSEIKYKAKSEIDSLTEFYNKYSSERIIKEILADSNQSSKHYFVLIDIDNFKAINDNLGHNYGDLVLKTLSSKLKSIFRSSDIIGRIGGDEFIVFVKDFENKEAFEKKLQQVNDSFRNSYSDGNTVYHISGSIGVCEYPNNGTTFEELYVKSDNAMYNAKRKGKNQYYIYKENSSFNKNSYSTHFDSMKRSGSQFIDIQTCFNIFELLYDVENISVGINKALSIIGNMYDIDICYVFETNKNGTIFNNTYEWCGNNIKPMIFELQGLGLNVFQPIIDLYDNSGSAYIESEIRELPDLVIDILEQQDVKSMLHCSIQKNKEIRAIIGFDNCSKDKQWNIKTINTLIFLSKILGMYIVRG